MKYKLKVAGILQTSGLKSFSKSLLCYLRQKQGLKYFSYATIFQQLSLFPLQVLRNYFDSKIYISVLFDFKNYYQS
jgi:hypothetical protein